MMELLHCKRWKIHCYSTQGQGPGEYHQKNWVGERKAKRGWKEGDMIGGGLLSEDVNDFLLVLLIVNCACLNVHLASLIVDGCSCLFVDTIERL